jgi:hypothetical protein
MDARLTELERQLFRARRQVRSLLTALAVVVVGVAVALAWPHALAADPAPTGKGKAAPPDRMQELFDLSVRRHKLQFDLDTVTKLLAKAEKEQMAGFDRVATPTGSDYWESISDNVVLARATADIKAGELLLYHAPGIYRVKDAKPKLTTKGECWYFKPDRDIAAGQAFTIELIHDAPEELANVKAGFMPHTDRARDPARAYTTKIHLPR